MTRFLPLALLLAVALSTAASDLEKFRNWDKSPQGHFLTTAEREQWKAVRTDADAEVFVNGFLAKRGPKFAAEVTERAAMADKYLTIGKTKGSTTLRGKLIVMFGPPANIQVADRKGKKGYVAPPPAAAVSNLGGSATARSSDGSEQSLSLGSGQAGEMFRDYTFTFPASASKAFEGSDLVVTVEADAGTGSDRLKDEKALPGLESKFAAVAEASIVRK